MNKMLPTLALTVLTSANAQNITFGKIQSPKAFQQYWGLDQEQMKQYETYMEVAGKYRYKNQPVNPLMVLSIIADSQEDKEYFAQKAAKHEINMNQREIETSWLITAVMQKDGMIEEMTDFTAKLTGIEHFERVAPTVDWEDGDELMIYIDKICIELNCLRHFKTVIQTVPQAVTKTIVFNLPRDKALFEEFQTMVTPLLTQFPKLKQQRFDAIEHNYLDGLSNQAAQVRNNEIMKIF